MERSEISHRPYQCKDEQVMMGMMVPLLEETKARAAYCERDCKESQCRYTPFHNFHKL